MIGNQPSELTYSIYSKLITKIPGVEQGRNGICKN